MGAAIIPQCFLLATRMLDKPGSSASPALQQIAQIFRRTGWISFWAQLVLTVVSSIILLFAAGVSRTATAANNPGTGAGVTFTLGGIFVLLFSLYWTLFRYVAIGRKLRGSAAERPKKSETIQALRIGLIASLVGTLLAIMGAEATVGALVAKAFSQGVGFSINLDPSKFIQPLDIFVVQASINVILAQFIGISAALWLLNRMTR
jgi:hypothetical protein